MTTRSDKAGASEENYKKGFRYNFRAGDYLYEESLAPNHVHLWLALCLHADSLDKHSGPLKLHIPDTLIYGFGKNPIWLHTDEKGHINKKLGDDCSEENIFTSFSGPGVVALDKEPALVPCINPASDFESQATVKYDGTYVCPLSAPSLRRLLLKPRQHPPRVFSIQKVVQTKYGDHSTVVRVCHHRGGMSSAWSMTRHEQFIERTASPSKQRRVEGSSAAVSPKNNTYAGSIARSGSARFSYDDSEVVLELKVPSSPSNQLRRMDTVVTIGTPTNGSKNYWSKSSFYKSKTFESADAANTPSKRQSVSEQNIEDITNLYDDNIQFSAEEPKRVLDSLSDRNCMIDEVKPLAAEPIVEIAELMSKHISVIFHRRLEELTIDVAKDDRGNYCLLDIVAFKFENIDVSHVKFPNRVKNRIEIECDCILDPFRSHLDPAQVHAAHKTNESKDQKDSGIDWSSLAMGASPCSMCESKLPPDQLCYAITSTLIQSTIVHMRSRLPQKYWPGFCRDSCYAVRSMLRIEGDPFNVKGLTVADIRICGLCYEICNKEMGLIEIEQKLSKFTRTTKQCSSGVPSPKAPLMRTASNNNDLMYSEGLKGLPNSPPKPNSGSSAWNPTENFRMRNRPSVIMKIAEQQTKHNRKEKHQPKMKSTRSTVSKVDLLRQQVTPEVNRPKSAGVEGRNTPPVLHNKGNRSPVKTSPIRRRPPPGSEGIATPDAHPEVPISIASTSKSMKHSLPASNPAVVEEHVPADGRSVVRSSISKDLTMCRVLVGIQQIKDLPVIIFEHFENFRVHYNVLGRAVDFPAVKKSKYYRKDAYRYKTFTLDGENDSVSLSSGGSGDDGSDFEDNADDQAAMFKSRSRSGRLAKVSEEDVDAEEESSEDTSQEDVSIVVGTLAVQRMRVSYAVIPGNSAGGAPSPELECYFSKNRRILVVLCGDIKDGADIYDENRWMSPPEGFSSASKARHLQHSLTNIRLDAVNKTLFQGKYSGVNSLRQKHLSRMFRKSYKDDEIPRSNVRKTERGEILPDGAIAYGYVNYYQFLNATVNRIDIVTPMTYALSHVPRERSVPMLKAVVGFERLYFPVDKLSLPYSLVNVGHSKGYDTYVAELEDQLSSSEPLPAEWLVTGAQDDSSSSRRKAVATTLQMRSVQESASALLSASKLDMESDIFMNTQATEFAANLVDGKRIAPVKFSHESRSEQKVLENRSELKVKNFKDEDEVRERNPNSLWCFSAHIVSGHHMGPAIPEHIRNGASELCWNYKFKFLGETTNCDCSSTNECGFDEVFRFNSLTKHYFLGEIAAVEEMFAIMEPIDFELKLMESELKGERRPSTQLVVKQKAAGIRGPAVLAIPDENAFSQRFTASFSLNEFKGQRFFESTLLLSPQIEAGHEKSLYPPYIFAEFHFFRMGGDNGLASLPRNLALGKEVITGVRRVVRKNKLLRTSSFTPVET